MVFVNESARGEVAEAVQNHPKLRFHITFDASKGVSSWDQVLAEAGGFESGEEMGLTEFLEQYGRALESTKTEGGLNTAAIEIFEDSGLPHEQLLAEKHRMLVAGNSDLEINNMISAWAERHDQPPEAMEDEYVAEYGTKIKQIKAMDPAAQDTALEQLAEQQIEAEERAEAAQAAIEVLEANDIVPDVREVGDISDRPADLLEGLPEKPADDIPFERRGRPVGAAITQGQRETILLAYGADSETGYHEAYHILRRRLTDKDRKVLDKYFKNDEEAEARAFATFVKTGKANSFLKNIWQKLLNILKKVKSGLQGRGFKTADDVFDAIQKGTVEKVAPSRAQVKYETRPIFYSKLEKLVVEKMPNKMDTGSFRNWLKKQGIKDEELDWSGVNDLIAENKKVTKEQVLATIAANDIEIEEVTKGGASQKAERDLHQVQTNLRGLEIEQDAMAREINESMQDMPLEKRQELERRMGVAGPTIVGRQALGSVGSSPQQSAAARDMIKRHMPGLDWDAIDAIANRFHQLQDEKDTLRSQQIVGEAQFNRPDLVLPGGENYTELLLRMPEAPVREKVEPDAEAQAKYKKEWDAVTDEIEEHRRKNPPEAFGLMMPDAQNELERLEDKLDPIHQKMVQDTIDRWPNYMKARAAYQSPHFQETNILAHIRFTDRWTADERRVLFIEEIQSDWHQAGRKKGYKTPGPGVPPLTIKETEHQWIAVDEQGLSWG
jgi:hypothetical protein